MRILGEGSDYSMNLGELAFQFRVSTSSFCIRISSFRRDLRAFGSVPEIVLLREIAGSLGALVIQFFEHVYEAEAEGSVNCFV